MRPCTTHPYMLLFPRYSGVTSLPLYTMRGRNHLPRVAGWGWGWYLGFMGCTMGFYRALSLSAYCPDARTEK